MECQVCHQRSSIGYCEETTQLVCEECSGSCYKCNGLIANGAGHTSPKSGHLYCSACWEERQRRRKSHKKSSSGDHKPEDPPDGTALDALKSAEPAPHEESERDHLDALEDAEEVDDEEAALITSAWRPPPPWKLSFQTGVIGLIAIIIIYIFPSLYRVPLSANSEILTPYIILIIPILAIIWGISGVLSMDYMTDKTRSLAGLSMGIITVALILYAVTHDPYASQNQSLVEMQRTRDGMTREELRVWRNNILDKHRQ